MTILDGSIRGLSATYLVIYALRVGALEDFIEETMSEVFWEKVSVNDTELPYPFYCFEDRDGFSYIVVNSVPLITDQVTPEPIKPYTFKEAATIIVQAFDAYLCWDEVVTKEELIDDLVQQFEHVSLVCSD